MGELNVGVWIIGFDSHDKLWIQAEVGLYIKGIGGEFLNLVGRELGLVNCVEVEGGGGKDENGEEYEAITAADAPEAAIPT